MKVAYLECATGISGDMTLAALIDSGVDRQAIRAGIDSLKLPGVQLHVQEVMKGCFRATSIQVQHPRQHAHRHLSDIIKLIQQAQALTPRQQAWAIEMFTAVGIAEARVHGTSVDHIHFHEVGAVDSIVDIVGTAIGFDLLGVDEIHCGPVPTGCGEVRIAHGLCPIPTPGTAELLRGIPLRPMEIAAELTTPTGAAIVRTFARKFGPLPEMTIEAIGYGAGTFDLPNRANVLRLFVGQYAAASPREEVCLLETNLDDVTGEVLGYVQQSLFAAGAWDVHFTPVTMKKNRPGIVLSVLASPDRQSALEEVLFRETGTLGIRHQRLTRTIRERQELTVQTECGPIRGKVFQPDSDRPEFSPEFDDCASLARTTGRPLREIQQLAVNAFVKFPQTRQVASIPSPVLPEAVLPPSHSHDHDHDHRDHDHGHE